MLDILIEGGLVIDGSGAPGRQAAVGVKDGRIVMDTAGALSRMGATRTIDGGGLVVAPGFIDIHTHYDAQLQWDAAATPSPLHGVTSVFSGNCGFTLAPLSEANADYVLRMMSMVEGMPLEALQAGVRWPWASFGEWLDHLDGRLAINAGFLVGHSTLRMAAMGERARSEPATEAELARMCELLGESLAQGGMGFSSSQSKAHVDAGRHPVPSRFATDAELLALSAVLRDHPGTQLEMACEGAARGFTDADIALCAGMSRLADRPFNWNTLGINQSNLGFHRQQLEAMDRIAEQGGWAMALARPYDKGTRYCFLTGALGLPAVPNWEPYFQLAPAERMKAFAEPSVREKMRAGLLSMNTSGMLVVRTNWTGMQIVSAGSPAVQRLVGRTFGEIGAERGRDPFDVALDLAIEDDLRMCFMPVRKPDEELWRMRAELWRDPRVVLGASDAGAHLDVQCGAAYTTTFLAQGVREKQLMSLEEAVHRLADVPARLFGLKQRGRIVDGWHADLVLFDPARIAPGEEEMRQDLPGGASRVYVGATGIEHVLVNGGEVVRGDVLTGTLPGQVIRSGKDTETVRPAQRWSAS
jgi:N-acyl-D-aspartate/D-glutamate deacylase